MAQHFIEYKVGKKKSQVTLTTRELIQYNNSSAWAAAKQYLKSINPIAILLAVGTTK